MDTVRAGADKPLAVVDYAHTPDALAKALLALREHVQGTLWCVFGCGGDRDAGKRALMGAIAAEHADQIIVTDDNPRSEDPAAITAAILNGVRQSPARTTPARIIHDRADAIRVALSESGPGDAILIAGKGHESFQIYGDYRRPFSDRQEVERCFGVAA
jgi:UDP-N-acetylmuramoyl-L-alanyl-D-glutamate--2,6-diaminopimelate ligase